MSTTHLSSADHDQPTEVDTSGELGRGKTEGTESGPPSSSSGGLPAPLIIDLATEGEFLTDDEPTGPPPPPSGPPAAPPAAPSPPPPPPPGGGMAPPGGPATYVTNNHYYPAAPAAQAPPKFTFARLKPVKNGSALIGGLILLQPTSQFLHVTGDEPGMMIALLVAAGLLELLRLARRREWVIRAWLIRAVTFDVLAASVSTGAGLHLFGYLVAGVWK